MTQGDSLSPTIFNVVVGAVVRHWVAVMVERVEDQGEREKEGRHQNDLFYTEDGMVASSDLWWIQGSFSNLVGLFHKFGLQTNIWKTFGIVCCP